MIGSDDVNPDKSRRPTPNVPPVTASVLAGGAADEVSPVDVGGSVGGVLPSLKVPPVTGGVAVAASAESVAEVEEEVAEAVEAETVV
jgi:hypothetical protein